MPSQTQIELAPFFQAALETLRENRLALNQADLYNADHGDHMVEIFEIAVRAIEENSGQNLADALEHAAQLLRQTQGNGSAQLYAQGLSQLASQLRSHNISIADLVSYVQNLLGEDKSAAAATSSRSGDILKALVSSLAGWSQKESGQVPSDRPLDMGALLELGMAYLQAKGRGGSQVEILADAAASASPLSRTAHRYQSGKLAIQALLQAMGSQH
jgi:hypothetical protein